MAACFENFGLSDLVARPQDAFRLATLASVEGQRVMAYGGEYCRYRMGDAVVVVRMAQDYQTGESELCGMDTHAVTECLWDCEAVEDISPEYYDSLSRRLLVAGPSGGAAAVDVVCAGVLPTLEPGTPLRLGVAGFPREIAYLPPEAAETPIPAEGGGTLLPGQLFALGYAGEAEGDTGLVRLTGRVKDVRVGETFMGFEPMTTFVRATVATEMGDVELCHTAELVAEAERDLVRPGAVVSALCRLSGDAATGAYAGGVVFDEAHDLAALGRFFREGGADRLRPMLHSQCVYASDCAREMVEGMEAVIALLKDVEAVLGDSPYFTYPGRLTESPEGLPYRRGKDCLILAQGGPEQYVALCFVEPDSLGRVRKIALSGDRRYSFEKV